VRSAYFMENQRREEEKGESSNKGEERKFWKFILALDVPGVLKNFLWKVSLNIIPTKANPHGQNIALDLICPICLLETETMGHILWGCRSSQAVWQESSRKIQKLSMEEDDGMALLSTLQEKLDEHDFIHAIMVARLIWARRNLFVFKGLFSPPALLVQQALASREEFVAAKGQATRSNPLTKQGNTWWSKPPMGFMKFNWDASVDLSGKQMGVGVIARNDKGEFCAAVVSSMPFICDPEVAEAIAVWRAFALCEEIGVHRVVLEVDSLNVVKAFNSTKVC